MTQPNSAPEARPLSSLPMLWGYGLLVLSIVFNGARYNLESAAMSGGQGSRINLSAWGVVTIGSFAGAVGYLLVGWVWRQFGWTAASLDRVSWRSCLVATRAQGWIVLLAAFCASSAGWLITESNKLYGPDFTAFLGNLIPVFLVLSGLLLGERLRRGEFMAIFAAIAGAFVFSYHHGRFNWVGIGLMASGCLVMAVKKTLMKHATGVGHLPSVMTLSLLLTGIWSLIGMIAAGECHGYALASIGFSVAGGIAGAMIGMSMLYAGLNIVGLARGAPIDSLRPLAVLFISICTGAALPGSLQLIGGALVLAGSAGLAGMGRRRGPRSVAAAPAAAEPTVGRDP